MSKSLEKDPKQPAYEIFSIECRGGLRNQVSKRGTFLKSGYLFVVGLSSVKIVSDMHRRAAYDNKH